MLDLLVGLLLRALNAQVTGAKPVQVQGLCCASWRGSVQSLLHQKVTFLSGGNWDFSTLQKHAA